MQKLHYSITINAPKEKVWDTLFADSTYRIWTKAFNQGSYFQGDWSQGSIIKFLGTDEEGGAGEGGMYSRIKENRPNEFMSIEHLGMINNGVIDTTSDEVKKWTPAFENYTLKEAGDSTELSIDIDINEEYKSQFDDMWPKALESLKQLAEK